MGSVLNEPLIDAGNVSGIGNPSKRLKYDEDEQAFPFRKVDAPPSDLKTRISQSGSYKDQLGSRERIDGLLS